MKNKLCSALIILCIVGVIFGCAKQTNEPVQATQEKTVESEHFEAKPLIIEPQEEKPIGAYEGTIVIAGAGTGEAGYEGLILITFDGDKIRITCTDAVRSKFGDRF